MDGIKVGKSDNLQRIDYIDTLRGLCMLSIVWYHTDHPDFLNYVYYNEALFFVSGLLFKSTSWRTFFKKKFFTLLIPFVFFYLIYYVFLLATNYAKYHTISMEIVLSIFDVFHLYTGSGGYNCNYPLWFIWALFWMQLMTNMMDKILKKRIYILVVSFVIYLLGIEYIIHVPTPFMIGRSSTYIIYYVVGYVFSRRFIEYRHPIILMVSFMMLFALFRVIRQQISISYEIMDCIEFITLSIALLMLCRLVVNIPIASFFTYFGVHSLIVFGMHDMYLTIFRLLTLNLIGEMSVELGFLNWILTLLVMVPTIVAFSKYIPFCVGKRS